jgi:hypothetical protein
MIGIKLVKLEGVLYPGSGSAAEGEWVVEYDPDFAGGRGAVRSDPDPRKAKRFASFEDAWAYARQSSTARPLREDGRPNRPLTAYSMLFDTLPREP